MESTTVPPKAPTDADVEVLGQVQQVELALRDLYASAVAAGGWSDAQSAVVSTLQQSHAEFASSISAILGRKAPNTPSASVFDANKTAMSAGGTGTLQAAADLESAAVAMQTTAITTMQSIEGAGLLASIQMAEARHSTALAMLAGSTAPDVVLYDTEQDALKANG